MLYLASAEKLFRIYSIVLCLEIYNLPQKADQVETYKTIVRCDHINREFYMF